MQINWKFNDTGQICPICTELQKQKMALVVYFYWYFGNGKVYIDKAVHHIYEINTLNEKKKVIWIHCTFTKLFFTSV